MVSGIRDIPHPCYPGQATFSPVTLTISLNRSHGDHQFVSRRRENSGEEVGVVSPRQGRVTLAGGITFETIFACRVSRNVWFLV